MARRLVIDPDNFKVSSDKGRICAQREGAWQRRLQKNVLPLFSRAEQRPFKIPVHVPAFKLHRSSIFSHVTVIMYYKNNINNIFVIFYKKYV